jgi:hypothetical protein
MPPCYTRDLPPTGELILLHTGNNPKAFYRMVPMPVTAGACGIPKLLTDGSIEYPQGDPPEILGYARVGRRFYPAWTPCRWRMLCVTHPNGCIAVEGRCIRQGKPILPADCEKCGYSATSVVS